MDRRDAWRAIDRHVLDRVHEPGVLHTTYPSRPELVDELEQLIRAEQECCPFLELSLHRQDATVRLELRYPPGFEDTLTDFLVDDG